MGITAGVRRGHDRESCARDGIRRSRTFTTELLRDTPAADWKGTTTAVTQTAILLFGATQTKLIPDGSTAIPFVRPPLASASAWERPTTSAKEERAAILSTPTALSSGATPVLMHVKTASNLP